MLYQIVWKETGQPFDNDRFPPLSDEAAQQGVCADVEEETEELMGKIEVRPVP